MGMSSAVKRVLSRKAADNSLEVEDLLNVAALGDAADAIFIGDLKAQHKWSDTGREGKSLVVPFGRWADVVSRFLEHGYAGVVGMARESDGGAEFCLGLLKHVRTPESAAAMLSIGGVLIEYPANDIQLAVRLAGGFNELFSFGNTPVISPEVEQKIRDFLHRLLALELTEDHRATVVCALRGVGDAVSMNLVKGLPPFNGCWAGLERSAVRQIRKRMLVQGLRSA